jgi:hypothetical protein
MTDTFQAVRQKGLPYLWYGIAKRKRKPKLINGLWWTPG